MALYPKETQETQAYRSNCNVGQYNMIANDKSTVILLIPKH